MNGSSHGRCLCGAIEYEVIGDPLWVCHCHCRSCRRATGAPVATFAGFRPEQVRFVSGEQRIYHSSPGVSWGFCATCGTSLSYQADRYPDEIHIFVATLDEPERCRPRFHVNFREHIPWFDLADDLPRHPAGAQADGDD